MFTGLVEAKGRVVHLRRSAGGARLRIAAPFSAELEHGESVSVNGACQTVVSADDSVFEVDVMQQTLSLTMLGELRTGAEVNLERALKLGDRMGGHMVTGHVDGVGKVSSVTRGPRGTRVTVTLPGSLIRYVVARGSIAIDGVSLTVAEVLGQEATVALIPETIGATVAGSYRAGTSVNVETDILAKQQEKLLEAGREMKETGARGGKSSGLTEERLRELGFMERHK